MPKSKELTLRELFDNYPLMKQRQFADMLPIHRVNFNEMVNGGKLSQWQLDKINEALHKLGNELAHITIKHDNMSKGRKPYNIKAGDKFSDIEEKKPDKIECPSCNTLQEHSYPMSGKLFCVTCGELLDQNY